MSGLYGPRALVGRVVGLEVQGLRGLAPVRGRLVSLRLQNASPLATVVLVAEVPAGCPGGASAGPVRFVLADPIALALPAPDRLAMVARRIGEGKPVRVRRLDAEPTPSPASVDVPPRGRRFHRIG